MEGRHFIFARERTNHGSNAQCMLDYYDSRRVVVLRILCV
jgi:hypothetical protein